MKLNSAGISELAKLQPKVARHIRELQTRHRTRHCSYQAKPANHQYYLGEGEQITFYAPNGKVGGAWMISESTVGAQVDSFNYAVGQYTPPLPEGTWIVCFQFFLGKAMIEVTYIGQLALQ